MYTVQNHVWSSLPWAWVQEILCSHSGNMVKTCAFFLQGPLLQHTQNISPYAAAPCGTLALIQKESSGLVMSSSLQKLVQLWNILKSWFLMLQNTSCFPHHYLLEGLFSSRQRQLAACWQGNPIAHLHSTSRWAGPSPQPLCTNCRQSKGAWHKRDDRGQKTTWQSTFKRVSQL